MEMSGVLTPRVAASHDIETIALNSHSGPQPIGDTAAIDTRAIL
jgi:hypothetical protein